MRKLKRILIVLGICIAAFAVYVEVVNRNSSHMTYRQKLLKAVYPLWMQWNKMTGTKRKVLHQNGKEPPVSFYSLHTETVTGDTFSFNQLRGKKVLLVNTASDCGYTNQYESLQALADKYKDKLLVLGFPSNDFKEQEKRNDSEIAEFCRKNFGVRFPLMHKSVVSKLPAQNPVYQWLTDPAKNGWNNKTPTWNFSKYLVNEQGILTDYFDPGISPLGDAVINAIEKVQ